MNLNEIIMKLNGPVCPVGSSHTDKQRHENLKALCKTVDELIFEIHSASEGRDRVEASISKSGKYANNFLCDLRDSIPEDEQDEGELIEGVNDALNSLTIR